MRLYKGIAGKHRWNKQGKGYKQLLVWALSRQPGDKFNGCDTKNHIIKQKFVEKFFVKNGWYIYNVEFVTTTGMYHSIQGGCATYPYTEQQRITLVASKEEIDYSLVENNTFLLPQELCNKFKQENPSFVWDF